MQHHEALRISLSVTLPCGCEVHRELTTHDKSMSLPDQIRRQSHIAAERIARRTPQHNCETKP